MRHIYIYSTSRMKRRIKRVIFIDLLCMARGMGMTPTTRDDTDPFGGCILPDHDPSTDGKEAAPGTTMSTTLITGGGE